MTHDQLIRRIRILENALEDIIHLPFLVEEKPWTWKDISTEQSRIAQAGLDHFPVEVIVEEVTQGNFIEVEEMKCIQCDNPAFKHPQTGKVYKLCALCGLKAIAKLLDLELDERGNLVEAKKKARPEG